jgi:RND family efflux transporter MFP subunit
MKFINKIKKTFIYFISTSIIFYSCSNNETQNEKSDTTKAIVVITKKPYIINETSVELSGQIESKQSAQLSTRFMGYITQFNVQIGDYVKKGELLIKISNDELIAKNAQVKELIKEAEHAYEIAKKDYERYTTLYENKSATLKELENAKMHLESMHSKLNAAKEMQNEVAASFQYVNITAPFNGIITQKYSEQGALANPGMPLLTIEGNEGYQVTTSVSEKEISKLKLNQEALIYIESLDKKYVGIISQISNSSQSNSGLYMVKLMLKDWSKTKLYSGMHCKIVLNYSTNIKGNKGIEIDSSAIVQKGQLKGVYTINSSNNRALLRWIKTGSIKENKIEVLSGLTADDSYIIYSEGILSDGQSIIVK